MTVAPEGVALQELITPRIEFAAQTTTRRKLPFRLCRKTLACPCRIGHRVVVGDMDHGILLTALDRARWPERMPPTGAANVAPPLQRVVQRDGVVGPGEDNRTRDEILRGDARKILGARRALGRRDVAGGLHELREVGVGDFGPIHPETVDVDAVYRRVNQSSPSSRHRPWQGARRRPSRTHLPESRPCRRAPRLVCRRRSRSWRQTSFIGAADSGRADAVCSGWPAPFQSRMAPATDTRTTRPSSARRGLALAGRFRACCRFRREDMSGIPAINQASRQLIFARMRGSCRLRP